MGVEITVNLQIDHVYAALRTSTSLQSLLNITVLEAEGIETASLTSKSRQWKTLPIALHSNCYISRGIKSLPMLKCSSER